MKPILFACLILLFIGVVDGFSSPAYRPPQQDPFGLVEPVEAPAVSKNEMAVWGARFTGAAVAAAFFYAAESTMVEQMTPAIYQVPPQTSKVRMIQKQQPKYNLDMSIPRTFNLMRFS